MFVLKCHLRKQKKVNRWIIFALRKGVIIVPTSPRTLALLIHELNYTYEIVDPYNEHVNLMLNVKINKFHNQHNLDVSNYFPYRPILNPT